MRQPANKQFYFPNYLIIRFLSLRKLLSHEGLSGDTTRYTHLLICLILLKNQFFCQIISNKLNEILHIFTIFKSFSEENCAVGVFHQQHERQVLSLIGQNLRPKKRIIGIKNGIVVVVSKI